MSYADVKAAILAHAVAAGGALTVPILDVVAAFPLPTGRCIRVYFGGETEVTKFTGRYTLNSEMIGRATHVAAFWPVTSLNTEVAAAIDAEMDALTDEVRTRLDGDATLGGQCSDLTLEYAEPDVVIVGNTRFAMILWRVLAEPFEYARAV